MCAVPQCSCNAPRKHNYVWYSHVRHADVPNGDSTCNDHFTERFMAWRSILLHCLVTGHVISATVGHRILAFRLWPGYLIHQISVCMMERKRESSNIYTRDLEKSVVRPHSSIVWGAMFFFDISPDLRPSGHWIHAIGVAVGRSTGRLGEYRVRIGSTSKCFPLLIL